ncbi:hypothetical protein [Richelia sinica]|uniref:hypothetical protein n=1 Tax=Richelia sinica TaxID=1357545 RepID=UPI0016862C47|nr:hypothetical protein [Richelia sinica]MBD2665468.1 hypothetical protein [Richelia sinica FACHB-800]
MKVFSKSNKSDRTSPNLQTAIAPLHPPNAIALPPHSQTAIAYPHIPKCDRTPFILKKRSHFPNLKTAIC